MPSIAREKQQFYKARIRSLLAVDHQMTNEEVGRKLAAENIELDRGFLRKLINEVYRERTIRADHKTLSAALAAFEDTMTEIVRASAATRTAATATSTAAATTATATATGATTRAAGSGQEVTACRVSSSSKSCQERRVGMAKQMERSAHGLRYLYGAAAAPDSPPVNQ